MSTGGIERLHDYLEELCWVRGLGVLDLFTCGCHNLLSMLLPLIDKLLAHCTSFFSIFMTLVKILCHLSKILSQTRGPALA